MHLSEGGGGCGGGGGNVLLRQGMWRVIPETGLVALSDHTLASIVCTDPIEKWYILDPEPIARGQFAVVYRCRHRVTGQEFAAKFASRRRLGVDATPDIVHEITVNAILSSCARHVKLHDVFTTDTAFILIMEYAPGGDLQTLLDENVVPYERDVVSFLRQLLDGLVFIHDRRIVHLDIKPQNLVLMGEFPDCAVKLCDFEISRLLTPGYEVREILGTPDYVAPEILHYEPITTRTDMWSLGVLTYVLLTGFLPFGGDSDQETFMQISRGELDFPNELFEDVTPEAIDFMKKLLIRQPEKRMSARECLDHTWMKTTGTRPTPPSTLNLPSPITPLQPPHTPVVCRAESSPSVITTVPFTKTTPESKPSTQETIEDPKVVPVTPVVQEDSSSSSSSVVPLTGRPPLHPRSSQKSITSGDVTPVDTTPSTVVNSGPGVTPLSATVPFLNKECRMGSRQNLSRLRSLSKSREVLSERIQMSNLKKTLSRSRERLYDARLGLSTSTEDLMNCKSLSQSVEALTALSQLHQNGALYKSCNNIFTPMIYNVKKEENRPERMYQSLASIDKIPGNDLSKNMGYFESRFTSDDYNDIITRRNTDLNMVISDNASHATMRLIGGEVSKHGGLRSNTCRGGRGAEGSDRGSTRHSHKQPETQSTQKNNKTSRADRMKKDAQRKRKERKERELREKERQRKTSLDVKLHDKRNDGSHSPTTRRGSVCHVEQRLQDRKEREGRKISITGSRRLSSIESDPSPVRERTKLNSRSTNLNKNEDRAGSVTPTRRRKSKVESPKGSDVSQASSMESVTGSLENIQPRAAEPRRKARQSTTVRPALNLLTRKDNDKGNDVNDNVVKETPQEFSSTVVENYKDQDEAYISLEEGTKDMQSIAEKSDDGDSVESDKTYTGSITDGQATPTETCNPITITTTEFSDSSKEEINTKSEDACKAPEKKISTTLLEVPDLAAIHEDSSNDKYSRSISTTSDLGSTISEESEENVDQFGYDIDSKIAENKARTRSYSVQHRSSFVVVPRSRNRSYSVHQPPMDKARPWGDVCSGSIAKALKHFTIQDDSSSD
uniref:Serine/threonine-protein kinase PKH3-like n=1 Tax=Hirondellea gigas TaxID=1518452 RepID=A0A2P2I3F1_9CRUS